MKTPTSLKDAYFTYQFTDNHQKHDDTRNVAIKIKTILHQRTDRAVIMFIEIIMMVLGNGKQARHQENNDYGL